MEDIPKPDPLDIPSFLKRDITTNRAEFMSESVDTEVESRPAKASKAKAPAKVKAKAAVRAAGKPAKAKVAKVAAKAKTAPKAAAKPAKAPKKAKVAKAKAESTVEKDQFGFRKGSAKSEAAAMYARKSGATLGEVKDKVGSVQLNVLFALEEEGHEVTKKKDVREGQRPVTRYFLKLK